MRLRLLPLVLLLAACASSPDGDETKTAAPDRPSVNILIRENLYIGRNDQAPVTVDVQVLNNAADPIMIRRIRVQSWAMASFSIGPGERYIREMVPAGGMKEIQIQTVATRLVSGRNLNEPLTLRAIVDYEIGGRQYHQIYTDDNANE